MDCWLFIYIRVSFSQFILSCFIILLGLCVDFLFYHRWLFTWYNFFRVNVQEGISSYYGTHSYLWYFYGAIPVLLGPFLPFFVYGCKFERSLLFFISPLLVILSCVPHKEFRFIQPLLPFFHIITGIGVYNFYNSSFSKKSILAFFIILSFCINALVSVIYTRGFSTASIAITDYLHHEKEAKSALFLVSHSCPLYAGVLRPNIHLDYIKMEPPFLTNYTLVNR